VHVGQQAPEFEGRRLSGAPVSRASLKDGPYAIIFFATWCGTCRSELPVIQRVTSQRRDIQVIVTSDETPAEVSRYMKKQGLDIDAVANGHGIFAAFGVRVLPTVIVVDADGRIAFAEPGGGAVSNGLSMLIDLNGKQSSK